MLGELNMEIVEIKLDKAKEIMKQQINNINVKDGVLFSTVFEKISGSKKFMKVVHMDIIKEI